MAVVFEDVNSTICQHTKLLQRCETLATVIDYAKCEKLVESMELYSKKLDKLIDKTTAIEKNTLRE